MHDQASVPAVLCPSSCITCRFYSKRVAEAAVKAATQDVRLGQCICESLAVLAQGVSMLRVVVGLYHWNWCASGWMVDETIDRMVGGMHDQTYL